MKKLDPMVGFAGGLANAYNMYRAEQKRDEWLKRIEAARAPKDVPPVAAPAAPAAPATPAEPAALPAGDYETFQAEQPAAMPPAADESQAAPAQDYDEYRAESDRLFAQDQPSAAPAPELPQTSN